MIDYYTAPPQHIFDDIKENAIAIWQSYDDTYGYASEKIDRIKNIENVKDNAWYIVAMFDVDNQRALINAVTQETADMIISILRENYE